MDIHEQFAIAVRSLDTSSPVEIARRFKYLTKTDANFTAASLLRHEQFTWELLSLLEETKDKTKLFRYATLKQWVSQIPLEPDLVQLLVEEEEVEKEVNNLLFANGVKRRTSEKEQFPRKKSRLNNAPLRAGSDPEIFYKQRFEHIRANDLTRVEATTQEDISQNYLVNEYIEYQRLALDDKASTIIPEQRRAWRRAVKHVLTNKNYMDRNKRILYDVMAGDADDLYNIMCKTWEDVVWSYLNAEVEEMLDKSEHLKMTDPTPILPSGVVSLANSKDKILRSDDSRTIFHFIQACLLSNNIEKMIHGFYHAFFNTEESSTTKSQVNIGNDPEQQAQLLRFLSTLITYGQKLLGWKENRYSFAIISKYASLNAEPEHLRPAVIASFAAKQSAENQIRIYSHFLQNFDGDNDEYAILIRLGKQLGLDMADILQYTYTHSFKKAMEAAPIGITDMTSKTNKDPIHFELQGDITEEYLPFFKAIKYLLVDDKSCVVQQAFDAINMTIRYFLGSCKVYLARRVIDLVPVSIAEFMTIESKKDSNARKTLAEFKGHRNLVNALVDFEKWSRLMEQKPTDRGDLDSTIAMLNWKKKAEEWTVIIEYEMKSTLENWLGEDANETAHISKAALRQLYIPEILIRYHKLLMLASSIIPKNKDKCQTLNVYITAAHQRLLDDITAAKRMDDVLREFSKSCPSNL